MKSIDKLYIHEEIEIFKPPEFILIYPNHQHQLLQGFQVIHYQKLPHFFSKHSTSSIPSDYLGSTPTSQQIRENPFNPPDTRERPPYWTTHSYTQGEPNLVNDPIDISTNTTLSSLPETLSLPSTPSLSQISPTLFPLNFPNNLDARYLEQSSSNIPLRLDWNTFVAPPSLFGQHQESNRLHSWALNRLQYRQDIHEDIREHNTSTK